MAKESNVCYQAEKSAAYRVVSDGTTHNTFVYHKGKLLEDVVSVSVSGFADDGFLTATIQVVNVSLDALVNEENKK